MPLTPEQQQRRLLIQQQQVLSQQQQREQRQAVRLVEVRQSAVARFWELLHDFVVMKAGPKTWLPRLAPNHPFLRPTADLSGFQCVRSSG